MGIVGSIGSAIGGAVGGGASASGGTAIQSAAAQFPFSAGGFPGTGGPTAPAGVGLRAAIFVHGGEDRPRCVGECLEGVVGAAPGVGVG
ncbi:hypothetical protein HmCmsJML001_02208 [Escherichia coli]|nr:hypothetical protein HmCmsJML001_02208 [Escherichia coli]